MTVTIRVNITIISTPTTLYCFSITLFFLIISRFVKYTSPSIQSIIIHYATITIFWYIHTVYLLSQVKKLPCTSLYQSRNLSTGTISWNVSLCFSDTVFLFSALTQITALPAHFSAWGKLGAGEVLCQTLWLTTKLVTTVCPTVLTETGVDSKNKYISWRLNSFVILLCSSSAPPLLMFTNQSDQNQKSKSN